MKVEKFIVRQDSSLREALQRIEANHYGMVMVVDAENRAVGLVTDGDIRRKLLENVTLDENVLRCANPDFVRAHRATPRELLLKQLDHVIRIIPILDEQDRLLDIITRDAIPIQREEPIYARARAPVRVSFGGGGSDLTHYFSDKKGAVINTTISSYCHATLRQRSDDKVIISSIDLGETLSADTLEAAFDEKGRFGLVLSLLQAIRPTFGFELDLHSDFPMKSGLGGSASVSAAILGCFNQFRRDRWDRYELAEIAFQAERLHLSITGGWQDQYATVFGGFNFMEFGMQQNVVNPLRINKDTLLELEESLVLCDTKMDHDSGNIHDDQKVMMQKNKIRNLVNESVDLTYTIRNQLLRGRLLDFGMSLDKAWQIKRRLSGKITNDSLDNTYEKALSMGALGGKLLGAGGGGFFLFYVPSAKKIGFLNDIEECGLLPRPFRFEPEGLQAWAVREKKITVNGGTDDSEYR